MYMQLCLVGKLIIEKSLKTTENNDNQRDKKIAFITTGAIGKYIWKFQMTKSSVHALDCCIAF